MKKIILLMLLTLAMNISHAQDTCNDNSIMSINGHWKKGSDANMAPDKNLARLTGTIDSISRLFQLAYPQPKGLEAGWYRTMNASPLTAGGPTPYNFNSLYKAWYCNPNLHKRMLADETGTWAYACVNNLGWLLTDQYDLLTVKVDNNAVYMLPPQKGTWKGYTTYESSVNGAKSRCLILTHGNQLPWKPVTQEQYLNGVKAGWQDQKSISAGSYAKQEESLKTGIAGIQHNSQLKAADKEKIIAGLQKNLDDLQKNKAAQIEKSGKDWNSRIAVIDNYISKNTAQLQQPAVIDRKSMNDFTGSFSAPEKGGRQLVSINPGYFNGQLPKYIPQLVVLYWEWDNNAPALNFKKQFEENFPIEKLKAMIDK